MSPTALAQGPSATITGGADASGHEYAWKVTNTATSPIVEVRFPHYRASLFFAPPGWSTDCTLREGVGVKDEPEVCTGRLDAGREGIAPGRSGEFRMQISSAGAQRRAGVVTVRFADGRESAVAGVELPMREPASDQYVALIGLSAIFILLMIRQARRKRKKPL